MKPKYKIDYKRTAGFLLMIIYFMGIWGFGITLNFMVTNNNGGRMPVHTDYYYDNPRHFSFSEMNQVNYSYLSDIIHFFNLYMSIGDVFMFLSLIGMLIIFHLMFFTRLKIWKKVNYDK